MRYTFILFAIAFLTFTGYVNAQPEVEWQQSYGGEDEDHCFGVIQTRDGGYMLVGCDESFGPVEWDAWVVKTDENGDSLWSREYGGDNWDFFFDVLQTEEGDYLFAGRTQSNGAHGEDFWLVRTDEEGEVEWSQMYNGNGNETCRSIINSNDNGYFLFGSTDGQQSEEDFYLVKIDEDGEIQWTHTYGGRDDDRGFSHVLTTDGGHALVGQTYSFDVFRSDGYLVKVDEDGEEEWYQTFGGRQIDLFYDLVQTEDGGYAIVGHSRSFEPPDQGGWLIRTDENGELIWQRFFGGNSGAMFRHILLAEDGGFILIGSYSSSAYLVRTNADGEELWSTQIRGIANWDYTIEVDRTDDGGFVLGGHDGRQRDNFCLVKLSPDSLLGAPAWQAIPDTSFNEDSFLELDLAYLFNYIRDVDDPDSTLEISIEDGEHIFVELQDEQLVITSAENWWGRDSLRLTITDPDEHTASTYLSVRVNSINDPPGKFRLWYPENNSVVYSQRLVFEWEVADRNGYNEDMVRYTIRFSAVDQSYEVYGIEALDVNPHVYYSVPEIEGLLDELRIDNIGDGVEINWSVTAYDDSSSTECDEPFVFTVQLPWNSKPDINSAPFSFALHSAFPNPFNSTTRIGYEIPFPTYVSIRLYNPLGQKVATLFEGYRGVGSHYITLSSNDLLSGLYFISLETKEQVSMQKALLIK